MAAIRCRLSNPISFDGDWSFGYGILDKQIRPSVAKTLQEFSKTEEGKPFAVSSARWVCEENGNGKAEDLAKTLSIDVVLPFLGPCNYLDKSPVCSFSLKKLLPLEIEALLDEEKPEQAITIVNELKALIPRLERIIKINSSDKE